MLWSKKGEFFTVFALKQNSTDLKPKWMGNEANKANWRKRNLYESKQKNVKQNLTNFFLLIEKCYFFHLKWEKWSKMMQKNLFGKKLNKKKQRNEFFIAWVLKKEAKWIPLRFILLETGAPGLICADCWSSSIVYSLHKQGSCWLTMKILKIYIYIYT